MDLKIYASVIEGKAKNQIYELAETEVFKNSKIRIMPDVHAGKGCVVGFTANIIDKVIPNVIGVDIGCGVSVVELGKIDIDYSKVDNYIKENIPSGLSVNSTIQKDFDLTQLYCYNDLKNVNRLNLSLGSLGGGNHFIEIDQDDEGNKYLLIHTGSRNLGLQVASIYQKKAIQYCHNDALKQRRENLIKEYKDKGKQAEISDALKELYKEFPGYSLPNDLCFLEGKLAEDYLHDMKICQIFAKENRAKIIEKITSFLGIYKFKSFESVHNYIDDKNIVRKGAISAHKDEKVVIPLNMKDGSIIGIGKGNTDWNESCSHGAGRVMSRSEAKANLSLEEFQETMKGIYSTTVSIDTIDESPMAYKNACDILDLISETIEVEKIITPVYNFKASE